MLKLTNNLNRQLSFTLKDGSSLRVEAYQTVDLDKEDLTQYMVDSEDLGYISLVEMPTPKLNKKEVK